MPATVAVYSVQVVLAAASGGASACTGAEFCIASELHRTSSGERGRTPTWYRNSEHEHARIAGWTGWALGEAGPRDDELGQRLFVSTTYSLRAGDFASSIRRGAWTSPQIGAELHTRSYSGVHVESTWGTWMRPGIIVYSAPASAAADLVEIARVQFSAAIVGGEAAARSPEMIKPKTESGMATETKKGGKPGAGARSWVKVRWGGGPRL